MKKKKIKGLANFGVKIHFFDELLEKNYDLKIKRFTAVCMAKCRN